MNTAAIIMAAGRGTRMNDDSMNKVCFDCAGVPVLRRIVLNMQAAGITKFVIIVGHKAESVMNCLDGLEGVTYVYQKEQKGTGHAALCGLKALENLSFSDKVVIANGDKIIKPEVIRAYLQKAETCRALYGVQHREDNFGGGRIALRGGKPHGVVELADSALLAVRGLPAEERQDALKKIGLSEKKIPKILAKAAASDNQSDSCTLADEIFTAEELLMSDYVNAGLYCFTVDDGISALAGCKSDNAQGELYLTDTMEFFARTKNAEIFVVEHTDDMLTYSTKPELIKMSKHFLREAEEFLQSEEDARIAGLIRAFINKYGNEKMILTSAPGRVNIMGRHVDHRGGNTNVMAIDCNTTLAVSPRDDNVVRIANTDPRFGDYTFRIDKVYDLAPHDDWISYIESEPVKVIVEGQRGEWINYVTGIVMRFQQYADMPLCGMDIMMDGNIPIAAGLSSSSSIVVATAEAIVALNCLNIDDSTFVNLCGEGEWFVGTRGGAGDQAAMKCSKAGEITQLGFKPFYVGRSAKFSDRYSIIIADSCIKAHKAGNSKNKFNAKVATYEIGFMMMKKYFPEQSMRELRDAAKIRPYSEIYRMLKRLPETATRKEIYELLPESARRIDQLFASHDDPGVYDIRGVILFGIGECARAASCITCLENNDYELLGKIMQTSQSGDRVSPAGEWPMRVSDEYLIRKMDEDADIALEPGAYGCSLPEIDALCDMLNETDGVLGSQMLGAGLGGCLAALVERDKADEIIDKVNRMYYDKHGFPHSARIYRPLGGSKVIY